MPICPIIDKNPECRKNACAWYDIETNTCAILAIDANLAFVACLREILEKIAEKSVKDETIYDDGEEIVQ